MVCCSGSLFGNHDDYVLLFRPVKLILSNVRPYNQSLFLLYTRLMADASREHQFDSFFLAIALKKTLKRQKMGFKLKIPDKRKNYGQCDDTSSDKYIKIHG